MALTINQTEFGFVVTCSGGTSAPVLISNTAMDNIKIVGIACGGAATTDITTVTNGQGNQIYVGCSATVNQMDKMTFAQPIRSVGLKVGFAGATTGYCNVYIGV